MPFTHRLTHWLIAAFVLIPALSTADPWIAPGDLLLRHDLEVLADAGIVRGPITTWPVPWPDVARDVVNFEGDDEMGAAVRASLMRVRRTARQMMRTGMGTHARISGAEQPDALRGFVSTPREEGEFEAGLDWTGDRFAMRLQGTAVTDADDGKTYRPDGSYLGVSIGNTMLSAGYQDRWWGPGWDGSLILSTSARPIPALTLERNYSDPFSVPVLKWFGPWRAGIVFGQLEDHRTDFDQTRFFAARVAFKPWEHLEIGLSRSAQWCGEGRPCGFDVFWNLFTGNDNASDDLTLEEEPGNQLAGYDLRVSSPWRNFPVAFYGQMIGEDEAGVLPSKFLGLFGLEAWGSAEGGAYRATFEYSDTSCSFSHSEPEFDCAYENGIYTAGYRFRGRSIGHSTDNDTRMLSLGALYVTERGTVWSLKLRDAELNRDATSPETNNTITPLATDLQSIDLRHEREYFGGRFMVSVGGERREIAATGDEENDWRGAIEWTGHF